jgi:S1-C subfamily serine protease
MIQSQLDPHHLSDQPAVLSGKRQCKSPRRLGATALLLLSLSAGIVGGVGASATATQWLPSNSASPTVITTQPASGNAQPVDLNSVSAVNVASSVYEEVDPSVVQVNVANQIRSRTTLGGTGSGLVVDEAGLILTNYHVIENASTITVLFSNGETRVAQVLGTDSGNDLALLKVDLPAGVPASRLGDSDQVQVGEPVIAIGSPFGLAQTVTQGIISAVDRAWSQDNRAVYTGLIQTDAPINPGNSGGPLVNTSGEVIGITNMIESPISGSVGIGFAVPINTAKRLLPQLETGAHLQRAWLGISGIDMGQMSAAGQNIHGEEGVLIASVASNSPAAVAGLRDGQGENATGGDIIVALNGQPVEGMAQLAELIAQHQPGDVVELTIIRSGQELEVTLTLAPWPEA